MSEANIAAKIAAIRSSRTTPNPFLKFLSMYEIGKGFEISNILNIISASKAYTDLSYCDEAIKITGIIASQMPANSSITIDL